MVLKDVVKKHAGIFLCFLLVGLTSGCATKKQYLDRGVKYPFTDWAQYTQDKDLWGNQGYFYPIAEKLELEEPKVIVKREAPPKPIAEKAVETAPVLTEKVAPKKVTPIPAVPVVKKKVEGEKEWCPKKKRTVIPAESKVIVADFDSGTKPNNMGYDFGAWTRDPADFTQNCIESFTKINREGTEGYSLQLYYDVDSPISAYNGFWCKLDGDIDYSVFKRVGFWVKGDPAKGYTKAFKVELKNCINQSAVYYVTTVSDEWQHIVVPFEKFRGLSEWSLLKEFVIVFEDRIATTKEGAIYIDDIYFEK